MIWREKTYRGRIVFDADIGSYRIRTEEGEYMEPTPEEVDFIIDSIDYK